MTTTNTRRVGAFAVFMVACGLFAIAASALPFIDAGPALFHSSSTVEPAHTSHSELQPQASEWPLLVAKQFEPGRPPEPYSLEVAGVRETGLIRLTASSVSPERARALASWLAESFVTSLRLSYSSRGLTFEQPARVLERPESLPSLSRWSIASVVFQFLIPSLLVIGGITLFRARQ